MKRIIAFCGAKESGKSTSATLFRSLITTQTKELAFADHLKQTASKVFNIEMKHFLEPALKERELDSYINFTPENLKVVLDEFEVLELAESDYDKYIRPHVGQVMITPRKLLQYIGTNLLHPIDPLIHTNFALKKLDTSVVNLITDLRFPQEFDALYSREDFLPVYVCNTQAELRASSDSHPSERGWQTFKDRCVIIDNNAGISQLTENLKNLIKDYSL